MDELFRMYEVRNFCTTSCTTWNRKDNVYVQTDFPNIPLVNYLIVIILY